MRSLVEGVDAGEKPGERSPDRRSLLVLIDEAHGWTADGRGRTHEARQESDPDERRRRARQRVARSTQRDRDQEQHRERDAESTLAQDGDGERAEHRPRDPSDERPPDPPQVDRVPLAVRHQDREDEGEECCRSRNQAAVDGDQHGCRDEVQAEAHRALETGPNGDGDRGDEQL